MPETVKSYIENLPETEKTDMTPLEAQKNAYALLEICESVENIKEAYPDEPLFTDLKSADSSKATRGLLYDIKIMRDDIKNGKEDEIKGAKDLTVYLVQKVFLEAKTIEEINEDLDKDLNPVFKTPDKKYVTAATFAALGIKFPQREYINSLKYTREGYSDRMAELTLQRWESLSNEEKESRINTLLNSNKGVSPEKREYLKNAVRSL